MGFMSLPHPNRAEGRMVFSKFHTEEIKRQEARDLSRFNLDFDRRMKGLKGEAQSLALHIMHVDPHGQTRGAFQKTNLV